MTAWARGAAGASALVVAAIVVAAPTTAAAAATRDISVNTGHGWTHDPSGPLFDFDRIAPGWSGEAVVDVRNDGSSSAELLVSAAHIVEDENGCNHPEQVVDTTCSGDDAGELGHELILTITNETASPTPVFSGTLYDVEQGVAIDPTLAAGAVDHLRVAVTLPYSSGNETQTDRVDFDLRLTLQGDNTTGFVAVEGVKHERTPGSLARVLAELPFTGAGVLRQIGAGAALVAAGLALWGVGAARRRRRPSTN